ncbi:hypothetical protein [Foetidibacter luteolus]|uniref:hypothetical protein n=1 Tax=Foetidibacter luteolus TaxID=2608880 RepID=UPI00129B517E|nr:hypothetical protein [Foetidibacter luteolus]
MKKRKHDPKKRIATSNWNKDDINPAIKTKIRFVTNKVPFAFNETFLNDKERLKALFFERNKAIPKYFIKLSNEMKNKNRVNDILKYATLYLDGGFFIAAIKTMQTHPKQTIVSSRPNAKIARK